MDKEARPLDSESCEEFASHYGESAAVTPAALTEKINIHLSSPAKLSRTASSQWQIIPPAKKS